MAEIVVEYADVISWDTDGHSGVSFNKNQFPASMKSVDATFQRVTGDDGGLGVGSEWQDVFGDGRVATGGGQCIITSAPAILHQANVPVNDGITYTVIVEATGAETSLGIKVGGGTANTSYNPSANPGSVSFDIIAGANGILELVSNNGSCTVTYFEVFHAAGAEDSKDAESVEEGPGESNIQTYTYIDFDPALIAGDVVTVHYSSLGNTLMDSTGKRLKDLEDTAVNCLDGPPIPPFEGGIAISFNGFLLYPNSGFSLQQNPMYMTGS